jgi:hypothetical protein
VGELVAEGEDLDGGLLDFGGEQGGELALVVGAADGRRTPLYGIP